jgi:hypothetical protein
MKRFLLLLGMLSAFAFNDLLAAPPLYIETKDGAIVFTDPAFTGTSHDQLQLRKRRIFHHSHIYNEATKKVTVGNRSGGFEGMLQKRTFRINLIAPGKTKRLD